MNSNSRDHRLSPKPLLLAAVLALGLTGCDADTNEATLDEAREAIAEGKHTAATLRLKDLLSRSPDDGEARVLLGDVYMAVGDTAAAEGEYSRALTDTRTPEVQAKWLKARLNSNKAQEVSNWFASNPDVDLGDRGIVLQTAADFSQNGFGPQALEKLEAVLAKPDADPVARRSALILKTIILSQRDRGQVLTVADQAVAEFPNDFETLLTAAGAHLMLREAERAMDLFKKAAEIVPDNPFARLGISQAALRLSDSAGARSQLDFLDATLHATAVPDLIHAQVAWLEGDFEQAEFFARRFLSKVPDSPSGLRLLGYIMSARGLDFQAKENFETYLSTTPSDDTARIRLAATLTRLGSVAESVKVLTDGAKLETVSPALLQAAGLALVKSGRQDEGMAMLRDAQEVDPENKDLRLHVASAQLQIGDFEAVQSELSSFVGEGNTALGADLIRAYMHQAKGDNAAAEEAAASLIERFPKAPQAHIYAGSLALADKKRLDEALAHFEKSVEVLETPRGHTLIGTVYLFKFANTKAKAAFEKALTLNENHVPALEGLSIVAKAFRADDTARKILEKAVRLDPARVGTRQKLIDLLLQMNLAKAALPHAHDLVDLNPSPANRVLLGRSQAVVGRMEAALLTFRELTEEFPKEGEPWYYLARTLEREDDLIAAAKAWQESLTYMPNRVESRFRYVRVLAEIGDFVEAKAQAQLLEERVPDNPNTWLTSGDLRNRTGEHELALEKFRKSFEVQASQQAAIKIAGALAALDRLDEGLQFLLDYIDSNPDTFDARMVYATTLARHGREEQAFEVFKAMEKRFGNYLVLNGLAYTALSLDRNTEAVDYARRARDLSPGNPNVLDTLGWALVATGQSALAIAHLERAVQLEPDNGTFLFHLATALLKSGELDGGRKALERAVAVKADYPERDRAKLMLDAQ